MYKKKQNIWEYRGVKSFYTGLLGLTLGAPIAKSTYFHNGTRAHICTCSISDGKSRKKRSIFLYMHDFDSQVCYIFSKKGRKMVSVTPEELYQMETKSMIIKPAYTPEEGTMQTDIINQSMTDFIRRGANVAAKKQDPTEIDMNEFFVADYEEDEEEK